MAGEERAYAAKLLIPTLQTARASILMYGRLKGEFDKIPRAVFLLAMCGFSARRNHAVGQYPTFGLPPDSCLSTGRRRICGSPTRRAFAAGISLAS